MKRLHFILMLFLMSCVSAFSQENAKAKVEYLDPPAGNYPFSGAVRVGNMLYLWIFGNNVEDRFGSVKFLIFYLFAGLAATFAQYYFAPGSRIPNVGASGAIAGVLGAYILMFPQGRVKVLLGAQLIAVPAIAAIGIWIALQLFSGVGAIAYTDETADVGGVAYMAHVGGFFAGLLLAVLLGGRRPSQTI